MLWKEIAKLELLSGSTRIALLEPNRFLNRKEPNRRGTDTTRTALRFFFTFLKPNEPKRTAGSLDLIGIDSSGMIGDSHFTSEINAFIKYLQIQILHDITMHYLKSVQSPLPMDQIHAPVDMASTTCYQITLASRERGNISHQTGSSEDHRLKSAGLNGDMFVPRRVSTPQPPTMDVSIPPLL